MGILGSPVSFDSSGPSEWGCWAKAMIPTPATFETLALNPEKKKEIMDDLIAFSKGEWFYSKIERAWKRGYLLYGPSGTDKTTMIATMANFLNYDVYDLELTGVKSKTELKKLRTIKKESFW